MAERKDDNGLDEFGNPLPTATSKYSQTQGYGMVPAYEQHGKTGPLRLTTH